MSSRLSVPWLHVVTVLGVVTLLVTAWFLAPGPVSPEEFSRWLEPHRRAWYALPAVGLAFVVLGLVMVPVMLLIAATGVAFGPILGPTYAMVGCLASASTGFAIGRWAGLKRIEHVGGERVARAARVLERNGTLAVF